MYRGSFYLSLFLLICLGCGQRPMLTKVAPGAGMDYSAQQSGRVDPDVVPAGYTIQLDLDPGRANYSGAVTVEIDVKAPKSSLWLHSIGHDIRQITLMSHGESLGLNALAKRDDEWLKITPIKALNAGRYSLMIAFDGTMTKPLEGVYRVQHADRWYIYSQLEPLGARRVFPCFDEPMFKAPFKLQLSVPEGSGAYSNAPRTGVPVIQNGRAIYRFKETPPMPTYLVAVAIGPLGVAESTRHHLKRADGSVLKIRILTPFGREGDAASALRYAAEVVRAQEAYFGTPYPYRKLDLVAVPDFGAGAMENAGLITYRDSLLLFDEGKVSASTLRRYYSIHAHEVAHMWFGNLVTMEWWDDLWLNEAFATWFAGKMVRDAKPEWESQYRRLSSANWVMGADSKSESRRIREPIRTKGDIDNAFDGITYTKGATVLGMFEAYIGADAFRAGIRQYLAKNRWGNATIQDLLAHVEAASVKPGIGAAMATFIDQAGVPRLQFAQGECREGMRTIRVRQSRWQPLGGRSLRDGLWHVPFCLRSFETGQDTCQILSKASASITVPTCGPVLPNPNGKGYYVWSLDAMSSKLWRTALAGASEFQQTAVALNSTKLFESGELDLKQLAAVADSLLKSKSTRLRLNGMRLLGQPARLVRDEDETAWRRYIARAASALVPDHGLSSSKPTSRAGWDLQRSVVGALGYAGDDRVRDWAKGQVGALLAKGDYERELIALAMGVYGFHGDLTSYQSLESSLHSATDANRRGLLMRGLLAHRFEGVVSLKMKLFLDDRIRANERSRVLWGSAYSATTRQEAWGWVRKNFPLIKERLGARRVSRLPYYAVSHCSMDARDQTVQMFSTLKIEGMARHLSNAIDSLEQCIEQRQRYGAVLEGLINNVR